MSIGTSVFSLYVLTGVPFPFFGTNWGRDMCPTLFTVEHVGIFLSLGTSGNGTNGTGTSRVATYGVLTCRIGTYVPEAFNPIEETLNVS